MIHILEEHFHDKPKAQVLKSVVLLANVVMMDYWCYSSYWASSCVTDTTGIVFSSGRTINPEMAALELIQAQKILYKFPHDREGYVYPSSTFYQRTIKIRFNLTAAKQEKRAFLREKSTGWWSIFFVPSSPNSFLKWRHREKMTSRHRKDLFLAKIPSHPSIAYM